MTKKPNCAMTGAGAAMSVTWRVKATFTSKNSHCRSVELTFDSYEHARAALDGYIAHNRSVEKVRICRVEVPA